VEEGGEEENDWGCVMGVQLGLQELETVHRSKRQGVTVNINTYGEKKGKLAHKKLRQLPKSKKPGLPKKKKKKVKKKRVRTGKRRRVH